MELLISNIPLPIDAPEEEAVRAARTRAGLPKDRPGVVYKRSVDARRGRVQFVYTVSLSVEGEEGARILKKGLSQVSLLKEEDALPVPGKTPCPSRPVICGFGPAGMFAGLLLARLGYRPIIIERGPDVDTRAELVRSFRAGGPFSPEGNIQFGEGGAGAFSDGKLVTRIHDPLCRFVLRELVRFGAPGSILKEAKPHVGTDYLRQVVRAIREEIIRLSGAVFFDERLTALRLKNGRLSGIATEKRDIDTGLLILAAGHSARDTYETLHAQGLLMEAKPFSVGVRIEHLQEEINRGRYGRLSGHPLLPPAEYQLSYREEGRAVYTFCMCPGGEVVPAASEEGGVVTNGMSLYKRDGENANSALVVSVSPSDFGEGPFAGMAFQRALEQKAFHAAGGGFCAPLETAGSFLHGRENRIGRVKPTYRPGHEPAGMKGLFPEAVSDFLSRGLLKFDRQLPGFGAEDALLTGVETRTSSPVRLPRGADFESLSVPGLYPAGEGAGFAGGIMSAAVDGLRAAGAIIEKYAPIA